MNFPKKIICYAIIKKGKTDGIMTILKNMLKNNMDDESIMKYTNVKKEEMKKQDKN